VPVQAKATTSRSRQAAPARQQRTRPAIAVIGRLLVGAAVIWVVLSALGLILTHVFNTGPVHRADLGVDVWFAHHRSPGWNSVMLFGTAMAETLPVIVVTAVLALLARWRLGHWWASALLVTSVAGEVLIFLAVTATVPQRRPPVPRLQSAPPTSSYPSGHTAAAVALYCCVAVLILIIYARRPVARIAAGLLFLVPAFVACARMYLGEHYPSDVIAGALLGALWLSHVFRTLTRKVDIVSGRSRPGGPEPGRREPGRREPGRRSGHRGPARRPADVMRS
jgi:membrane-associated phospholipid phosphatase